MKHTLSVTAFLVAVFFLAQVVGLLVVHQYIDKATAEGVTFKALPMGIERPDIAPAGSAIFIMAAMILGTLLILLIIRLRKRVLWKSWFLLAVIITLIIAFSAFMPAALAFSLAILLGAIKVFRPNLFVHNLTELFVYGGLAAIFVPIMNIAAGILLLLLISLYDMYAVWKSKHMVAMANFQTESNIFAGLYLPYKGKKITSAPARATKGAQKQSVAILGGGDVGFPLLFAGVVMKQFLLVGTVSHFLTALIIPLFATAALALLFFYSKKGRFYPAMPFLTLGCLAGYGLLLLIL